MGLTSLNIRSAREDFLAGAHEQMYKVEFAYHLARREWGQGYAPEAAGALVHWALGQPTIHRIWTTCDVDNIRSVRVLEKLGLEREGTLRRWLVHPNISAEPRDALCFGRVK